MINQMLGQPVSLLYQEEFIKAGKLENMLRVAGKIIINFARSEQCTHV